MNDLYLALLKTGVTTAEFAVLVKAHRITVHRWVHGQPIRQELQRQAVDKMVQLLMQGYDAGMFPLGRELTRLERMAEIRRRLQNLFKAA